MRGGDLASPGGEAAGQLAGQVITQLGADVNRELRVEGSCEVRPTDGDRSYEMVQETMWILSVRGGAE